MARSDVQTMWFGRSAVLDEQHCMSQFLSYNSHGSQAALCSTIQGKALGLTYTAFTIFNLIPPAADE